MDKFILREISDSDIETEISNIGFDKSYVHIAKNKFEYLNIAMF